MKGIIINKVTKHPLPWRGLGRLFALGRLLLILLFACPTVTLAQTSLPSDSIVMAVDSMFNAMNIDSLMTETTDSLASDTSSTILRLPASMPVQQRDWTAWRPDPQKALWLALVIPGGGQIYNRKYWKLPIVYGGFVGCIYAMRWNNMMYKDYAQAYLDIMDDDPGTASYNKFLHLGRQINSSNEERYKTIFKKRKDKYRRYRDLSFFVMIGVYAISVIDAYVDAELSAFDISKDLSLKLRPTVITTGSLTASANPFATSSLGVNCSIQF
ncbi:MAG: hypothetical protein IJT98_06235 [Prevotella sp.]|nr:hypothetical protein [Prevotella sp.]